MSLVLNGLSRVFQFFTIIFGSLEFDIVSFLLIGVGLISVLRLVSNAGSVYIPVRRDYKSRFNEHDDDISKR